MPRRTNRLRLAVALAGAGLLAGCASAPARADDSPSGQPMPRGNGPLWTQVVHQEFTKPAALGTFAEAYKGWAGYDGNRETSRETARPAGQVGVWNSRTTTSVHDGVLDCVLSTIGERPQICAVTPTKDGQWWTGDMYGKYVVRFRTDRIPAYKIAWLLWPETNRWADGEIDFPEGPLDGSTTGSAHDLGNPEHSDFFIDATTSTRAWHTATIDWRPGRLTFRLDGRSWTTTDPKVLPQTPMRWALQAESQIETQPPARTTRGHITIDWVTSYRWKG